MEDYSFEGNSARTDYIIAELTANAGDSYWMAESLKKMVEKTISAFDGNKDELRKKAGYAFFNLAKRLETGGVRHKISAQTCLNYAIKYYNEARVKVVFKGLKKQEIEDFLTNSDSKVSIRNLEMIL